MGGAVEPSSAGWLNRTLIRFNHELFVAEYASLTPDATAPQLARRHLIVVRWLWSLPAWTNLQPEFTREHDSHRRTGGCKSGRGVD